MLTAEEIMQTLKEPIFKRIAKVMGGDLWWEDVLQEVAIKVYMLNSYSGKSSLKTYLIRCVKNAGINFKRNKGNSLISLEEIVLSDKVPKKDLVVDERVLPNLENYLMKSKYEHMIQNALEQTVKELTGKEVLMLMWRYEYNLQLGEMAAMMNIHQANVTRRLDRLQKKIKDNVEYILSYDYDLSQDQIHECCIDLTYNKGYAFSLIAMIKKNNKYKDSITNVPLFMLGRNSLKKNSAHA